VTTSEHAERFTHLRPLLFTIVYEILGSATESDDVLQDSYLRWAEVDLAGSCLHLCSTKTGRSTRPLGEAAVEELRGWSLNSPNATYVFPNRRGDGPPPGSGRQRNHDAAAKHLPRRSLLHRQLAHW